MLLDHRYVTFSRFQYISSLHRRIAGSDSICSACHFMTYVPSSSTLAPPFPQRITIALYILHVLPSHTSCPIELPRVCKSSRTSLRRDFVRNFSLKYFSVFLCSSTFFAWNVNEKEERVEKARSQEACESCVNQNEISRDDQSCASSFQVSDVTS